MAATFFAGTGIVRAWRNVNNSVLRILCVMIAANRTLKITYLRVNKGIYVH